MNIKRDLDFMQQFPNFSREEFSEDPVKYASAELLRTLQEFRNFIDVPIHPSPAEGALARDYLPSSSLHYITENALSRAVDVFIDAPACFVFTKLLQFGKFTGIGIYFDRVYVCFPRVLYHLDIRNINGNHDKVLWYQKDRLSRYVYLLKESYREYEELIQLLAKYRK